MTNVDNQAYTYDDNGNLLSDGSRTFTYSVAGRLVQVVSGTLTTQFTYNGDGHRLRKVADGVTTTYVIAILPVLGAGTGGLPQVLVETTGGNSTAYLHGHDLLAEEDTAWAWHLNDGLGSVRQLTGGNGDVTLTQGYTPFGLLLWQEGDTATTYGFTGEQQDPAVALVFLRARYYDPATGRFLSKDLWSGNIRHPSTSNPYVYVLNNAPNGTDPTGEIYLPEWDVYTCDHCGGPDPRDPYRYRLNDGGPVIRGGYDYRHVGCRVDISNLPEWRPGVSCQGPRYLEAFWSH